MSSPLIQRKSYTPPAGLPFLGDMTLTAARVHEFCGPARRTLALMLAGQMTGPVFWIHSHWQTERLNGEGVFSFIDPARITFITPKRTEDILWSMEESLRAGCVPLVVAEPDTPPPLTPIRRLHLAAEQGAADNPAPIGILLSAGTGGAQGVESRWHLAPAHKAQKSAWALKRLRARMAPEADFQINRGKEGVVLAKGEPALTAQAH